MEKIAETSKGTSVNSMNEDKFNFNQWLLNYIDHRMD